MRQGRRKGHAIEITITMVFLDSRLKLHSELGKLLHPNQNNGAAEFAFLTIEIGLLVAGICHRRFRLNISIEGSFPRIWTPQYIPPIFGQRCFVRSVDRHFGHCGSHKSGSSRLNLFECTTASMLPVSSHSPHAALDRRRPGLDNNNARYIYVYRLQRSNRSREHDMPDESHQNFRKQHEHYEAQDWTKKPISSGMGVLKNHPKKPKIGTIIINLTALEPMHLTCALGYEPGLRARTSPRFWRWGPLVSSSTLKSNGG